MKTPSKYAVLFLMLLTGSLLAAEPDAEVAPTAGETWNGILLLLIGVVAPIMVRASKMLIPQIPSWMLPILGPALVSLANWISAQAGGPHVDPILAALLGAAGTGIREIKDQVQKKASPSTPAALLIIALGIPALVVTGCSGPPMNPENVVVYAEDVRDLSELGTKAALMENPEWRSKIELARDALTALAMLPPENVTYVDLLEALSHLPIKELKSEKGQIYVTASKIILRRVGRDVDIQGVGYIHTFAVALRDGISEGLQ